jgi:hypothetical protein
MRRYFKKNIDQTDLFELVGRLDNLKAVEAELNMVSLLGQLELNLIDTKKDSAPSWVQVSIDSIINEGQ